MKVARVAAVNSQAVRKHFVELTGAMLTPFAPYCQPAGPQFGIAPAPGQEPPRLAAFSHAEFIERLQSSQLPPVLLQRFRSQASMSLNSSNIFYVATFVDYMEFS